MIKIYQYLVSGYQGHAAKTWIAVFAAFINSIGASVSVFISLYLANDLNMSIDPIAFIISAFGVGIFFGSYLGGHLCDRFKCHHITVGALLLSGVSTSLFPLVTQFPILLFLNFSSGLFFGMFRPANTLLLFHEALPEDRPRINGLYRASINLGMGFASVIGGILASISFPLVFWFDSVTSVFAAVILFFYFQGRIPRAEVKILKRVGEKITNDNMFFLLCVLLLINSLIFFQIKSSYPIYLNKFYAIDAKNFGYLFFLNCIIIVLCEVPLLNSIKTYNQSIIAGVGSLCLGMSMFILPFDHQWNWAVLSCVILTLGEILVFSNILTLIIDRSSESNKGRYIGIYQSTFGLAGMMAPIVGGYIYSFNPIWLWYGCGILGITSLCMFLLVYYYDRLQVEAEESGVL